MSGSDVQALHRTDLPLPLLHRGKVRDVYAVGDDRLLMVASDRVSAFDVILPDPVPRKGEVLTLLTAWWLRQLEDLTPHHLLAVDTEGLLEAVPELATLPRAAWDRRSMLVRRTEPVLVECVVRGYLAGSAWKEYRERGTLAGEPLAAGLRESEPLDPPLFSPATKAQEGHDENISFLQVQAELGEEQAEELRRRSLAIYQRGVEVAAARGILLADTKFEFGVEPATGRLLLIDEVLTPDSSRYWPAEHYAPGRGQPSLDKQPVRDYLAGLPDWNGHAPGPELPTEVVEATTARYLEIFQRLTGTELDAWQP
jgi:phosphoribosylaminoimidazole-succinocarboxamide synthase